jgi:hypothetical protein
MLQEFLATLVGALIVDPLQAEMNERLAQVSLPKLAERAMAEPLWVVTTTLDVWTGRTAPEEVLGGTSAQCDGAIKAARVYLESRGA